MTEIPRKPTFPAYMVEKLINKIQADVQQDVIPVSTGIYSYQKLKNKLQAIPKPQIEDYQDKIFFQIIDDRLAVVDKTGEKCPTCDQQYNKKNTPIMCNFCATWSCTHCMPGRKRPHPLSKDGSGKRYNACARCDLKYLNLQLGHSYVENRSLLEQAILKTSDELEQYISQSQEYQEAVKRQKGIFEKNKFKISMLRKEKLDLGKQIKTKIPEEIKLQEAKQQELNRKLEDVEVKYNQWKQRKEQMIRKRREREEREKKQREEREREMNRQRQRQMQREREREREKERERQRVRRENEDKQQRRRREQQQEQDRKRRQQQWARQERQRQAERQRRVREQQQRRELQEREEEQASNNRMKMKKTASLQQNSTLSMNLTYSNRQQQRNEHNQRINENQQQAIGVHESQFSEYFRQSHQVEQVGAVRSNYEQEQERNFTFNKESGITGHQQKQNGYSTKYGGNNYEQQQQSWSYQGRKKEKNTQPQYTFQQTSILESDNSNNAYKDNGFIKDDNEYIKDDEPEVIPIAVPNKQYLSAYQQQQQEENNHLSYIDEWYVNKSSMGGAQRAMDRGTQRESHPSANQPITTKQYSPDSTNYSTNNYSSNNSSYYNNNSSSNNNNNKKYKTQEQLQQECTKSTSQLDQQQLQVARYSLIKAARDNAVSQRQRNKIYQKSIYDTAQAQGNTTNNMAPYDQEQAESTAQIKKCQCTIY